MSLVFVFLNTVSYSLPHVPSSVSAHLRPLRDRQPTDRSGPLAAPVILLLWFRRQFRHFGLHLQVPRQKPLKPAVQRLRDIRPLLQPGQQHARRLDGGQAVAARLLAELAVARRTFGAEDDPLALQHPRIAPPQRLGLAPGAIQQHDALDIAEDGALVGLDFALAVDGDDIAVGLELADLGRAEIEHGPARGVVDRPSQRLGEAGPGQADLYDRILETERSQPRYAYRPF